MPVNIEQIEHEHKECAICHYTPGGWPCSIQLLLDEVKKLYRGINEVADWAAPHSARTSQMLLNLIHDPPYPTCPDCGQEREWDACTNCGFSAK